MEKSSDENELTMKLYVEKSSKNLSNPSQEYSETKKEDKESSVGVNIENEDDEDEREDSKEASKYNESKSKSEAMDMNSKVDSAKDTKNESEVQYENTDESMEVSKEESFDESKDEEDGAQNHKKGFLEQTFGMRGKIKRKKGERSAQITKIEEVAAEGKGTPLKDIPYILARIQNTSTDDLKLLHRLAYNRPGTASEIKNNLYKFKGFPFSREDKEFERKKANLGKVLTSELRKLSLTLGLGRKGIRGDHVEKIIDFLLEPHDTGMNLPKSFLRSSTSKDKKSKFKRETENGNEEVEFVQSVEFMDNNINNEDENDNDGKEDKGNENEKSKSESEEQELVTKSKKAPKTTTQQKKRPKEFDFDDGESEHSEASEKKPKKKAKTFSPTDLEIKTLIKNLLGKANVKEVTVKKLCQQIYDNYPGKDLSNKKDFIKSTLKSLL